MNNAYQFADSLDNIDPQLLQAASSRTIGLVTGSVELQDEDNEFMEAMVDVNLLEKPANHTFLGHELWKAPHMFVNIFSTLFEVYNRALMLRSQDNATLLKGYLGGSKEEVTWFLHICRYSEQGCPYKDHKSSLVHQHEEICPYEDPEYARKLVIEKACGLRRVRVTFQGFTPPQRASTQGP